MIAVDYKKALEPCPFCKEGETQIQENRHSPTMSGGIKEPISVDIIHWCKGDGLPRRRVNITGRTMQEAIAAWNTRALQPCAEAMTEYYYEVACFKELENLYGKVRAEEYLIAMRCTIRALAKSGHLKVKA